MSSCPDASVTHGNVFVFPFVPFRFVNVPSVVFVLREKKKEKEREELWKKLEDLELKRGLRSEGSSQLNKNNAMYP